jgi:hypothetical protein
MNDFNDNVAAFEESRKYEEVLRKVLPELRA